MIYKLHLLVLVVSYLVVCPVVGEEPCTPSFVRSLSVSDQLMLEWTPPSGDCPISYYLITIIYQDVELAFTYSGVSMNVSYVPTCEDVLFTVIPVSTESISGGFRSLHLRMPVHADAVVRIAEIRLEPQSEGSVLLSWDLDEEYKLCTNRFRVLIYHEDYDEAVDTYVENKVTLLTYIRPCEDYTFGVTAIHSIEKEGPISLIRYSSPPRPIGLPFLQQITLRATRVDLKWQLDSFSQNRCTVSSILIDSSPYFTINYPVHDEPNRPFLSTNITSLQPDTMYYLNVTIVNSAGPSAPYLIAVQTLLSD